MAFEGLSEKLQGALKKMTGRGRLTEQAVKDGMREVRMALLEADVNYAVAKDFIRKVTDRCVGADVLSSLTPSQQVIRIVTTVRCDPSRGFISKESPAGRAVLGHHAGDRVVIEVSEDYSYEAIIRSIVKGADDGQAELMRF